MINLLYTELMFVIKGRTFLLLILIFLLGFFLRFYNLSQIPAGFQMDEASKGYSAYSLLKTGKDDNNNFLPLNIDIFGDNSPAGYHYLAIIPVAIFGLNEFAVRISGALFGSLTIFSFYFLVFAIFRDKKISLLSSLLLAVSPWHINMSRASSESLVALFFIITGFAFIFRSISKQQIKQIVYGTIFLSLSFLFYQTPRMFVPLFFVILLLYLFNNWKFKIDSIYKKSLIASFIFLLVLVCALFFIVPGGKGRFTQVSIFNAAETNLVIDEQIKSEGIIGNSTFTARLFHNKILNFSQTYLSNYLKYYSLDFLFIRGLPPLYQIPSFGLFYTVELPFVFLGVFLLLSSKKKYFKIPLIWLFVGPMTAAIATDTNNLQRALVMYPMFEILVAFSLIYLFTNVTKQNVKLWTGLVIVLFLLNFIYFTHQYYVLSTVFQPWYRNNGFSEMMKIVNKNYDKTDKIITTKSNGGYPLFQFYSKYDPAKYQKEGSPKDKNYKGFGKFLFSPENCPFTAKDKLLPRKGKLIFIEDGSCRDDDFLKNADYEYVLRVDGTKAFKIVYFPNRKIFE